MPPIPASNLLIDASPILIGPKLACKIGLPEAIVLQQVRYWLGDDHKHKPQVRDGRRWVYNTYEGWRDQFPFWSIPTIKRTFLSLEKMGLLISSTRYNRVPTDRTKWYTIDFTAVERLSQEEIEGGTDRDSMAHLPEDQDDPMDGVETIRSADQIDTISEDQNDPMERPLANNGRLKLIRSNQRLLPETPSKDSQSDQQQQQQQDSVDMLLLRQLLVMLDDDKDLGVDDAARRMGLDPENPRLTHTLDHAGLIMSLQDKGVAPRRAKRLVLDHFAAVGNVLNRPQTWQNARVGNLAGLLIRLIEAEIEDLDPATSSCPT